MADESVEPTSAEEEAPAAETENQTPPSQATDTSQLTLGERFPHIPADTWVDDLGLRNATRNVLKSNGLNRFGNSEETGLWIMTENDLLGIRRFGKAKLTDLLVSLEAYERERTPSPEGKTPTRHGRRSKAAGNEESPHAPTAKLLETHGFHAEGNVIPVHIHTTEVQVTFCAHKKVEVEIWDAPAPPVGHLHEGGVFNSEDGVRVIVERDGASPFSLNSLNVRVLIDEP